MKQEPSEPSLQTRSRRQMLVFGGMTLAAGGAVAVGWLSVDRAPRVAEAPAPLPPDPGTKRPPRMEIERVRRPGELSRELFVPHLNSTFVVKTPEGIALDCKLIEVSPSVTQETPKGDFLSYSLLFEAERGDFKDGCLCEIKHDGLKEKDVELFLAPVGRPQRGLLLEASISHRI